MECSLCFSSCKNPFTLKNCAHTFCKECIREWDRTCKLNPSTTDATCPMCRTTMLDFCTEGEWRIRIEEMHLIHGTRLVRLKHEYDADVIRISNNCKLRIECNWFERGILYQRQYQEERRFRLFRRKWYIKRLDEMMVQLRNTNAQLEKETPIELDTRQSRYENQQMEIEFSYEMAKQTMRKCAPSHLHNTINFY